MTEERPTNAMIERLEAQISEEGLALMEELVGCGPEDGWEGDEEAAARIVERMKAELPLPERQSIMRLMPLYAQAYRARAEEHIEAVQHAELARSVIWRAAELTGNETAEGITLGDAVQVLESHGESPPEHLDLRRVFMVPQE